MRCALRGFALLLALVCPASLRAQTFSPSIEVPVPGGRAGVAEALGMPAPSRAVFIPELARHIYGMPEGKSAETDRLLGVLAAYVEGVERFDQALSAVQPRNGTISLGLASDKNGRKRLKDFLDLLGLDLREKSKKFSVETSKDKKAAGRAPLLHQLGVDPAQIARRLNAGESVRVEVTSEPVPLSLDAATWSAVILAEKVPTSRLFARVMGDRKAALLAYGLAWDDEETLLFLAQNAGLLRKVYDEHAAVFAAFGRSVHVHGNRVVVPGGHSAEPLWEVLVDEKVAQPDRFLRALLEKNDGRLAYFYDTVANLDEPHARFALGLWVADAKLRAERFAALAATSSLFEELRPKTWPFIRPRVDLALLLARVRVQPDGEPAAPAARRFWEKVFDSMEIPDNPARELRNLQQDGTLDAAWLAEKTMAIRSVADRTARLDAFMFGQRVFHAATETELPGVLVALRSLERMPALMLTLERIGIADPAVYAAAARRASSFTDLARDRAFTALAQFQASLALVARLHAVRSLDDVHAAQFVRDLIAVEPQEGTYRGAIARWVESLLAALPAADDATEELRMLNALAGVRAGAAPQRTIQFEGSTYKVDLAGAELRRLTEVRRKQGGNDLTEVLALAQAARSIETLGGQNATVADVRKAAEALKRAGEPFKADRVPPPPGLEPSRDPRQVIANALKDLGKISKPKDVKKAPETADSLYDLSDAMLARTLLSWAYALALGDPDGTVLLGADPSRRHDFGFLEQEGEVRRRTPWLLPAEQMEASVPWHVVGSALALDVGLSRLALRRVSADAVVEHADRISANDQRTYAESVALLDPLGVSDADRDALAATIARGRARVEAVNDQAALDALVGDVHSLAVDGLRRRALLWTLANAPAEKAEWIAMTELAALGTPSVPLNAWGMSGLVFDACLCTMFHGDVAWQILAGQETLGMLPAKILDLNLRVAEISAEMKIPASLSKPILAAAVRAFLDRANPSDRGDWMTLVRTAQRITREEVEDDMAALTANGMLVPVESGNPGATVRR